MADVRKIRATARIRLLKNTNKVLYDQIYEPADTAFDEAATQVVTITTNTSRVLDQGSVVAARHVFIQVNNDAEVRLNSAVAGTDLLSNGSIFMSGTSVTEIKILNNSLTNDVEAIYVVVD